MSRPDLATLISGLSVLALGTVLLLDQAGQLNLDFGWPAWRRRPDGR